MRPEGRVCASALAQKSLLFIDCRFRLLLFLASVSDATTRHKIATWSMLRYNPQGSADPAGYDVMAFDCP